MKKIDKIQELRLLNKRRKKLFKRRRRNKSYHDSALTERKEIAFKKKIDGIFLARHKFELNAFLDEKGNRSEKEPIKVFEIDEVFSLENRYSDTVKTISHFRKSIIHYLGDRFEINFEKCKKTDFGALFVFKAVLDEYIKTLRKMNEKTLYYKVLPTIIIKHSKDQDVNFKLLANHLIKMQRPNDIETEFVPVSVLNLITGRKRQSHYSENKKGYATTALREYINNSLRRHHFELDEVGIGYFDGIISEILNNAEDHSIFDNWFAFANLFESNKQNHAGKSVGEVNLAFMNFGYSIFEGFEESKKENYQTYSEMEALYNEVSKLRGGSDFTKENYFTLYALQEGYSRLKYREPSRGTGTMTFIRSFLNIGDYEDVEKGISPCLTIYSGSTKLKCDNQFKPYHVGQEYFLSLNAENDLGKPPSKSHLTSLDLRFPGTLIVVKIYLNEAHLRKKIESNGNS